MRFCVSTPKSYLRQNAKTLKKGHVNTFCTFVQCAYLLLVQELVLQRTLQIAEERLYHLKHSDAADARALVLLLSSQQQVRTLC